MNWIVSSLLMFLFSNILYLLVRKGQKEGIPNVFNNLAMFFLPGLIYLIFIIAAGYSLIIPVFHLIIIALTAFFFSYLGNAFSLKGIKNAPNPGFSLILSKSYVVYTSVFALLVFRSELTMKSVLAMILIIFFSALIVIDRTGKKKRNLRWVIYSLGAFFCWGSLALVSKFLISTNLNVFVYLFYLSSLVSIFIFLETRFVKQKFVFTGKYLIVLGAMGLASAFFNLFMQFGYKLSPNPGYVNAVNASSISLLTLLSAYFFRDELTPRKIIGICGVTVGLIILLI